MLGSLRGKSLFVKWVELDALEVLEIFTLAKVNEWFAILVHLASVLDHDCVLRSVKQLILAVRQPSHRANIVCNVVKGRVPRGHNLRAYRRLYASHLRASPQQSSRLVFRAGKVFVLRFIDVPNDQRWLFHHVAVITRCKELRFLRIPGQRLTLATVLHHTAGEEYLVDSGKMIARLSLN